MSGPSGTRPPRNPEADWLGWREAVETILANCAVLPTERTQAAQAMGCAVAEDVIASIVHPPWDNSAMDGFAVHAADVRGASLEKPVTLPVSDDIPRS